MTNRAAASSYRLADLTAGQRLNIYLPEDRFSLTVMGSNTDKSADMENATE